MRCPICEKEQVQGSVCDTCGFDSSRDYEGRRTLCSVLPAGAEPVSVRAERWKQQQKQTITEPQRALVCPRCGGKQFSFLIDELQFLCADCGGKMPAVLPVAGPSGLDQPGQGERTPAPEPELQPEPELKPEPGPQSEPKPKSEPKPEPKSRPKGKLIAAAAAAMLVLVLLVVGIGQLTKEDAQEKAPPLNLERTIGPTVAAGRNHTVGLKSDGTVVAAGSNVYGQCNVDDWTDIVAVAAGSEHTVGLKSDGTVVAVGSNTFGQCNVYDWTDIVAVAADGSHTVGLRSDGTVMAGGLNPDGRCNVSGWKGIVAVTAGQFDTVGLKSDGTVVAVGYNGHGQCNVSGWKGIVAVAAGWHHTVGLESDGTVMAAGHNNDGQCDVSGWTDIVAVAAGGDHAVGLKADGTMVAVGRNDRGQCDVSGWTDIVAVAAGWKHTVGLRADGTVAAVGNNYSGQCGVDDWTDILIPDGSNRGGVMPPPKETVDLAAFAQTIQENHEFPMMEREDPADEWGALLLEDAYPGLRDMDLEQIEVYLAVLSFNGGELALVQAKNANDAAKVREIFDARVAAKTADDSIIYPDELALWQRNTAVVSNGSYVMLVNHEDCDAIVDEFNALFS